MVILAITLLYLLFFLGHSFGTSYKDLMVIIADGLMVSKMRHSGFRLMLLRRGLFFRFGGVSISGANQEEISSYRYL